MSFADMKKNREKMFAELNKTIQDNQRGGRQKDERIWYPSVDQQGNGFAVIRFLPPPDGETVPYVSMWHYGFKDRNGWYIENSRTTLGINEADPVHQSNKALRAEGSKASIAIANRRKASQSFFANIYVVRDPANPENEGKVFLFRFGKKIMDKITAKMNPEFEGETKMNPFDLWDGANLRLKIKTDGKTPDNPKGFRNYDNSEWDTPGPLLDDDKKMEKVWRSTYSLQAVIAPDQFKSYDELKARFETVTGEVSNAEQRRPTRSAPEPEPEQRSTSERFRERDTGSRDDTPPFDTTEEAAAENDDADLEFYKNLLN